MTRDGNAPARCDTPELSVITPMFNEADAIEGTVVQLRDALELIGVTWELIVVDDGSSDDCAQRARIAAGDDARIRVIGYERNRGRGYALRTGIDASRGRYVVTTESDLTWGADIPAKLHAELLRSGADVVVASPYRKGGRLENVPLQRALLSRWGNVVLRTAVGHGVTMVSGMTRGYVGDVVRALPLDEDRKEIHLEILSKACLAGHSVTEIPAILRWPPEQRQARASRSSRMRLLKLIGSHLVFGFSEAPAVFLGVLGALLMTAGVAIGLFLAVDWLILGRVVGDRPVTILTCIFLVLSGLNVFLVCLLSLQNRQLKGDLLRVRLDLKRARDDA